MKLVKEISLGYLKSKTIGEAVEELKGIPLLEDADPYVKYFNRHPVVLSPLETARVLKIMRPEYGIPTHYESDQVLWQKMSGYTYGQDSGRVIYWKMPGVADCIKVTNKIYKMGLPYGVNRSTFKIACPMNCFVQVLLKSDDPEYWTRENARRYEIFLKNRKIREVRKRIDRE